MVEHYYHKNSLLFYVVLLHEALHSNPLWSKFNLKLSESYFSARLASHETRGILLSSTPIVKYNIKSYSSPRAWPLNDLHIIITIIEEHIKLPLQLLVGRQARRRTALLVVMLLGTDPELLET